MTKNDVKEICISSSADRPWTPTALWPSSSPLTKRSETCWWWRWAGRRTPSSAGPTGGAAAASTSANCALSLERPSPSECSLPCYAYRTYLVYTIEVIFFFSYIFIIVIQGWSSAQRTESLSTSSAAETREYLSSRKKTTWAAKRSCK